MPSPSVTLRSLSVLLLCALCAFVGCDDTANSNIGTEEDADPNGVDPDRQDNQPPREMGVDDQAVDPPPDAGADSGPERDMGGGELYEDVGAPDGEADGPPAPPPDAEVPCAPMATRPCPADDCADSFQTCVDGAWGPCEPPAEVCDGVDNDCDGTIDDGFALGEPCSVGVGACSGAGRTVCGDDGGARCDAVAGAPEAEGCNQVDDDCDGTIDEDFGGGAPCQLGLGQCAVPSVEVCIDERIVCFGEADEPRPEQCNGLDDDCDGQSDEDFDLGAACDDGLGACRAEGLRVCGDDLGAACLADGAEPGPEQCNGVDDDCDGTVDEGAVDPDQAGPCVEGEGACRAEGRVVCDGDGDLRCDAEPGAPSDELCNGLDDDCDGALDEGFRLGAACTVGGGACAVAGVRICADDGRARCSAVPGEPRDEICNGLDDDCDGETDEGFPVEERCEVGLGLCMQGGRFVCTDDGADVRCDAPVVEPVAERCNDRDDDCDGTVDEGFGVGDACVGGEGACAREGRRGCLPDGTADCLAEPGQPAFERCDGIDDDCDGRIDEGLGLGGECEVGRGACLRPGRVACADDGETLCAGQPGEPADEACNGADDDCDGAVDEALVWQDIPLGERCAEGVGACRSDGRVVCDDDGAATCDAEPGARRDELCDTIDDDCDGAVDEGFDLGAPCTVGIGECLARGQRICDADGGVQCSAAPGAPAPESCNGLDDDCDGLVDEGQALDGLPLGAPCAAGIGRCEAEGEVVCSAGAATCSAEPGAPRAERCDGVDDDCDGLIDEGLGLGDGCTVGRGTCARDGAVVCGARGETTCDATAGDPRDELCDGADDDCDGAVDEDYALGDDCAVGLGACRADGITVCAPDGSATRCGARPGDPVAETCNTIDDDCDGIADERLGLGDACALGIGVCRAEGAQVCADDGGLRCDAEPGVPAAVEACDGADDDCDGAIDEGYRLGEPCVSGLGICAREGERICAAGRGACDAEPGEREEETCNDLDDDCDGIVDEGEGDQAGVAFGLCGPRYRSCLDALQAGGVESGVYRISPVDGAGSEVYCDQTTDGGGWTLVMATDGDPTDGRGAWHEGLLDPFPAARNDGVWAGLEHLGDRPFDLRFACRAQAAQPAAATPYSVDIAFYGTPWYRQFIGGDEAASCFATTDDQGQALPARKDLIGGQVRAHGQPYPAATGGRLVGEPRCQSPEIFLVDFDDGGVRGASLDGTDWGSVAGRDVCGQVAEGGQWLVFAREDVPHPLGPLGLINLPQLADPIEAAGFEPVLLTVDDPDLPDLLDPAILPAVFIGRYAQDWPALPDIVEPLLGCYTFDGGSVVTEFDGFSLLGTRLAPDFVYLAGAPSSWGWLSAVPGGGHVRALDTPIDVIDGLDPVTRGLGVQFSAGEGSERFLSLNRVHPTVPLPVETLATFAGDGAGFPDARYPALVRANQCGGSLLAGTFDYADAPDHPTVLRLVGNLAAAAVSPPDGDLPDACGGGIGQDRCDRQVP